MPPFRTDSVFCLSYLLSISILVRASEHVLAVGIYFKYVDYIYKNNPNINSSNINAILNDGRFSKIPRFQLKNKLHFKKRFFEFRCSFSR